MTNWETVFQGRHMEVYHRPSGDQKAVCFTFDYLSKVSRPPDLPLDNLIDSYSAAHIHITTLMEDWYQNDDLPLVMEHVAYLRGRYGKALAYGGSMGAYGAMLFSRCMKPDRIVAMAPQFSIDPSKAPFERRWEAHASKLNFRFDDMEASVWPAAEKLIVYDPGFYADAAHARLFTRLPNARAMYAPCSGHYPLQVLLQTGALREFMAEILFGAADQRVLSRLRRSGRNESSRYLCEAAIWLGRRRRFDDAFRCIARAYAANPEGMEIIESTINIFQQNLPVYNGLSHMLLRLMRHERPEWTHYDGSLAEIWETIGAGRAGPSLPPHTQGAHPVSVVAESDPPRSVSHAGAPATQAAPGSLPWRMGRLVEALSPMRKARNEHRAG